MATTHRQNPRSNKQQRVSQKNKPQPAIRETPLSSRKAFYILLALLGGMLLFVFHDFLLLNKVFLYKDIGSDSINGWYPDMYHIADYLHNLDGFPRWSFYLGMGQNATGFLFGDPFELLLYFSDPNNIAYLVGITEALKFLCAGLLFYLFLRELALTPYTAIIGAMCFAFCGFIVLGSCWRIFSAETYQVAFLLFSIEKLLHKKWCFFPFAIALIGVTVSFNLFIYTIVTGVYVLLRLYNQYGWNRKIITVYGQLIGLGILGVGISAFILISKAQLMLDSPRVSGEVSYFSQLMNTPLFQPDGLLDNFTKIGRFFSNDMLGTGNYFAGAENYLEAPLFYGGLLSLLLFTQFFPALSKRKKWVFWIVFICALLPFIFPFFRYAFWLFAGKYYRGLSFLFSLLLQMFALLALNHICITRKINYKILAGTFVLLLLLLSFPNILGVQHPYQAGQPLFQAGLQSFCLLFLLFYAVLLSLLPVKSAGRYVKPLLIGL
ncbi:MAG: YfhO family protein, partial [Prevotellaceae bacterium]|nr:YfhO family protein [Prevotellaceae bacterium]